MHNTLPTQPRPIRAVISGYYGFHNLGDDSILLAISRRLSEMSPSVSLTVLSNDPESTMKCFGLDAVHRYSLWDVLRALKSADLLISGGGSLLQNSTSNRSLIYYFGIIRLAKWLKKTVFFYAQGIGPLRGKFAAGLVRRCMKECDAVTLRDSGSLALLRSIGVKRQDITVTGDPVFTLKPERNTASLRELGIPDGARVIGISVRSVPEAENYPEQFAALCDRLIQETGAAVIFLVMQESEDEPISRRIQSLMREKSFLAKTPDDPAAMLSLIRGMDAVVAMRLHAIIFAAVMNVPAVGCEYDPKVTAILNQLGLPSCGTPQNMDANRAYETLLGVLSQQDIIRTGLRERTARLTAQAERTDELLQEMLFFQK